MYLYINDIDQTDFLHRNSISISDELQQRVNSANFRLSNYFPNYFDDVKIYEAYPIFSYTIDSIILKKSYWEAIQNNLFRVGDLIDVNAPFGAYKTIESISSSQDLPVFAKFTFDGNATDVSGNGHDGTVSGALLTTDRNGTANKAYDFDGVDDYIQVNDAVTAVEFNPTTKEGVPKGIAWKPDGLSLFIIGSVNREIHKWNCSTAWDTNTAVFSQSSTVVFARETDPQALGFSSDGTKCYVLGNTGADITYFSMSSAWDLSTMAWVGEFSVSGQVTDPRGMFIKQDGTAFYVVGDNPNRFVYQYSMTAWDMSTASYTGKSFNVLTQEEFPQGISFSSDGLKMFIMGLSGDDVTEYSLSTAWDVSTCTATGVVFYVGFQNIDPVDMFMSPDGMRLFMLGVYPSSRVFTYTLGYSYSFAIPTYTNGFTIMGWIRADSSGEGSLGTIVSKCLGGIAESGYYYAINSNTLRMIIANRDGTGTNRASAAGSIVYGTYYHIATTVDSTGLVTHRINTVVSGTPGISAPPSNITYTGNTRIGNRSAATDRTYDGVIDDIAIYSGVLTEEEIFQDYIGVSPKDALIKLTFTEDFGVYPSIGDIAGRKRFAGNIVDISDSNQVILKNVEFDVTALDYTRIFDKKLINDTFVDRDARYIVNDFCNSTINQNIEIDEFNYADNTALRVVWSNSPTLDTADYREGDACMNVTALSTVATLTAIDISTIVKTEYYTGRMVDEYGNYIVDEFGDYITYSTPFLGGSLGYWYKSTNVTNVVVKIGSSVANYYTFSYAPGGGWIYFDMKFRDMTEVGTVDLESITYVSFTFTSPSTPDFSIDGIRILETDFFKHFPYVEESSSFQDFRINMIKPTEVMQRIADSLSRYWYIDYDKNIHLFTNISNPAPFGLNETSNNFANLSISHDTSRLVNRQVVRGGEETSESLYSQVVEGNSIAREWIMKNRFKNLSVFLNDGSVTDTTEGGTTTTNIKATAHGLQSGDYIVNRTRSNAVREVTVVDADNFTVAVVTGQTSGDSISLFTPKLVGVEGINMDTSYNYMSNYNEKSIRSADNEATLPVGSFLLFTYNEVIPILVQATDGVSMQLMRDILGYSDGIFDGQPIVDQTISSRSEAIKTAEAIINKYSNVVITATFTTEQEGLESGQLIRIKDTTSSDRDIDQDFIIQSVKCKQIEWGNNRYSVTCSSLLFGMLELLQQLLANNRKIKVDENEVVNNIETAQEILTMADVFSSDIDGESNTETMVISDVFSSDVVLPPFYWGDIGGGPTEITWEEFVWS